MWATIASNVGWVGFVWQIVDLSISSSAFVFFLLFSKSSPFDFTGAFAQCIDRFRPTLKISPLKLFGPNY